MFKLGYNWYSYRDEIFEGDIPHAGKFTITIRKKHLGVSSNFAEVKIKIDENHEYFKHVDIGFEIDGDGLLPPPSYDAGDLVNIHDEFNNNFIKKIRNLSSIDCVNLEYNEIDRDNFEFEIYIVYRFKISSRDKLKVCKAKLEHMTDALITLNNERFFK